jgi:hypothetical protein
VSEDYFYYDLLEKIGLDKDLFKSGQLSPKLVQLKKGDVVFSASDFLNPAAVINNHNDIDVGSFLVLVSGKIHVDMNSTSGKTFLSYDIFEPLEACFITASIKIRDKEFYANVSSAVDSRVIVFSASDLNLALKLSNVFSDIVLKTYTKKLARLIKFFDKSK